MKRSSHHIIIPILAIVLLAVSSCFKTDTGIPSIRAFEELIRRVPVSGVRLNVTARTLNVGDTYTLTPTVTPSDATEKGVSWTSSNIDVATVDQSGKVTALKEGSATITAKTTDGGYTATCSVTVKQPELVPPEAVDLGLSVKWASWNLGASKPEEYGGYYQWAGTEDVTSTSINLDWSNCPYHIGSNYSTGWTKYVPAEKSSFWSGSGSPDNRTVLDFDDDVAHVNWGGSWRMPTDAEWTELRNNCTWTWTSQNRVNGYKVTSKKSGYTDKSIFLPAAGYRSGVTFDAGSYGGYWSSSLGTYVPSSAYNIYFSSDNVDRGHGGDRYGGRSVRPVYGDRILVSGVRLDATNLNLTAGETYALIPTITPSNAIEQGISWTSDNTGVATVDHAGKVTAVKAGSAIITVKTTDGGYTATCSVTVKQPEIEAVDLGLSVKWAACNIGALKPEEYGGYYQWAGMQNVTSTSIYLDLNNCPYHTGTSANTGWTKYVSSDKSSYWSGLGSPDNKTVLDLDDDVAHVNWGGSWRMPTDAEWTELRNNCTWIRTVENGVNGYKVTSKKSGYTDKSIFLPAAGYRFFDLLSNGESSGKYWSSSLDSDNPYCACIVTFYTAVGSSHYHRYYGLSVRPVYGEWGNVPVSGVKLNTANINLTVGETYALTPTITPSNATEQGISWSSDNTSVATVDQSGKVTALNAGSATITVRTTDGGYTATCSVTVKAAEVVFEAVDLGLSVKWANWNVGASKPEEYGGYYQWAGTQDVTSTSIYLDLNNCPYHTGTSLSTGWTKYIPLDKASYWSGSGSPDNKTILDLDDDMAHVTLGDKWRMPTEAEWTELRSNCTWTWTTQNGVYGYKLTSRKSGYTDKSIFLPAAGNRSNDILNNTGTYGYYWSSSLSMSYPEMANYMYFGSIGTGVNSNGRYCGQSLRPVYGERKIPVSSVKLNNTSLILNAGDTYILTKTVYPTDATEKGVSWSSDNTGVATVDQNGMVTAQNVGSAIITVQTTEGGHTASCIITVKSSSPVDADYLALLGTYTFTANDYFYGKDVTGTLVVEKGTVNATYKISIPGINFCPENGPHIDYFECPWDNVGKKSFSLIPGTLGSEGMTWSFGSIGDSGIKLDIFYFNNPDADIDAIVLTADQDGNLSVTSPVVPEEDSIYLQSTIYNADGDTGYVIGILVFDKGMKFIKKDASAMKNTVRGEFQPWRVRAR